MSWTIEPKPVDVLNGEEIVRISIGGNGDKNYLVFRGDPNVTMAMLKEAMAQFKKALPALEIVND